MTHAPNPSISWADLMDLDPEPKTLWRPEELAAVFRHQLSASLSELDQGAVGVVMHTTPSGQHRVAQPMTFGYVLHDPYPPIELLRAIKAYAKRHLADAHSGLPSQIANALYFIAIAAAVARRGQHITGLTTRQIQAGVAWTIQQPWLDETTRRVLHLALGRLKLEETS